MYDVTLVLPDDQQVPWRRLPSIPPVNTRILYDEQYYYVVSAFLYVTWENELAMDLSLSLSPVPAAVLYTPDAVPEG